MLIRLPAWFLAAALCAASFSCVAPERAGAASEFCAAAVKIVVPLNTTIAGQYVAQLESDAPATVSGELAIYSAGKIYTVKFPAVTFNQVTRSQGDRAFHFTYHVYESAPVYFTFAEVTPLEAVWVADASLDGKPAAQCPAMPFLPEMAVEIAPGGATAEDLARHAPLRSSPAELLGKFSPGTCSALYSPPVRGHVPMPFDPHTIAAHHESDSGGIVEKLAVDDTGHVLDAWPLAVSASDELNQKILQDAKTYTFKPAMFLCQPIPSYYIQSWSWDRGFGE